ncbi:MAG: DNA-formamidopyrimidine glycosylase [Anaerolineae bacterium]
MPELPEVETIKNDLRPILLGGVITGVHVGWEGCVDRPSVREFSRQIVGSRIEDVGRRGKFLVFTLSGGKTLLVHLRMTGRLLLVDAAFPLEPHARFSFRLDNGEELRFVNVRKFGRLYLVADAEEVLRDLGPEPLDGDFRVEDFCALFDKRRGMIKPLLLNQRFIAGLGNIYVDEALFKAGLHPQRTADTLTTDELCRLYDAIREVLRQGIEDKGTSRSDYVRPDGSEGMHQESLLVSGRAGDCCPRCGTTIERLVVGGRGTFICPRCQEQPAPSA